MRKKLSNPIFVVAIVCAFIFWAVISDTVESAASDLLVRTLSRFLGVSTAKTTAMITFIALPCIVAVGILYTGVQIGLRMNADKENVRVRLNTDHSALKILFGDTPPFDIQNTSQNGTKQRIVSIGIHNGGDGLLTNCEVYVKSAWPAWHQQGDTGVLLERGFDLHSGQTRYVAIASFGESFSATRAPGDKITICMPLMPGYSTLLFLPVDLNPQKSTKQFMTVQAKSVDTQDCEADCYLWVDHKSHGARLRLEKA